MQISDCLNKNGKHDSTSAVEACAHKLIHIP